MIEWKIQMWLQLTQLTVPTNIPPVTQVSKENLKGKLNFTLKMSRNYKALLQYFNLGEKLNFVAKLSPSTSTSWTEYSFILEFTDPPTWEI